MLKNTLSFLLALATVSIIGCGGNVDMRALVEEARSARAERDHLAEENARLERDRDALMAGRPVEETSGGDTASVSASASVAPVVPAYAYTAPATPYVTTSSAALGIVPSIDGVDSGLMFAAGMRTPWMAYLDGTQPAAMRPTDTILVMNSTGYDIEMELMVPGRAGIVHVSEGSAYPDATVRTSGGYAAAPVFRSGDYGGSARYVLDAARVGFSGGARSVTYRYRCHQTAGGAVPSDPGHWSGSRTTTFISVNNYWNTITFAPGSC